MPIKVLIVDDSGFMRLLIKDMLATDESIEVLDVATDGKEGFEKTKLLNPDVILLDLVMQGYDGIYALKKIMREVPKPVIILSGASEVHPEKVFEAMNMGAFDFVAKPSKVSKFRDIQKRLVEKIKSAHTMEPDKLKKILLVNNNPHTFDDNPNYEMIVIGASTGGTSAIESILQNLPCNMPIPILIIQHIPTDFGFSFAGRLSKESPFKVKIPDHHEPIRKNGVYLAPSNTNMVLKAHPEVDSYCFEYSQKKYPNFHFPSINMLMMSVASLFKNKTIGIQLTGMGSDGKDGMAEIFKWGGYTIAQSKEKQCGIWNAQSSY